MTEWTPTAAGVYRRGRSILALSDVHGLYAAMEVQPGRAHDGEPERLFTVHGRSEIPDGGWSLLEPDRQPGAPTVEQLERWAWWALWCFDGRLICGVVSATESEHHLQSGGEIAAVEFIICSAPIQPTWEAGPRWVPLEVTR